MSYNTVADILSGYATHSDISLNTSPLAIMVPNLDTTLNANNFTWSTQTPPAPIEQYDAQTIVMMNYSDAVKVFQYSNDNSGVNVATFDSSNFKIKYPFTRSGSTVSSSTTGTPALAIPSTYHSSTYKDISFNSDNKSTFPNNKWNGFINTQPTTATKLLNSQTGTGYTATFAYTPLISSNVQLPIDNLGDGGISADMFVPMSWDYVFNTSKNIFGSWASFPLFDTIYTTDATLQTLIDVGINSTLTTKTNVTSAGSSSDFTIVNDKFYNLTDGSNVNMMSTIFNTILKYRPERFINTNLVEQTKYPYPLYPGDTLSFKVTIAPNANQQFIGKDANESLANTMKNATRTYLMTILIDDDSNVTDVSGVIANTMLVAGKLNKTIASYTDIVTDFSNAIVDYTNAVDSYLASYNSTDASNVDASNLRQYMIPVVRNAATNLTKAYKDAIINAKGNLDPTGQTTIFSDKLEDSKNTLSSLINAVTAKNSSYVFKSVSKDEQINYQSDATLAYDVAFNALAKQHNLLVGLDSKLNVVLSSYQNTLNDKYDFNTIFKHNTKNRYGLDNTNNSVLDFTDYEMNPAPSY